MPSSSTDSGRDAAPLIAEWAADITYESLPGDVTAVVKSVLLDTLGTTLAANTLGVGCQQLLRMALSSGGSPESTLLGSPAKVPAVMAALVNGGMAHALNYDDISAGGGHMGVTTLPAALAVAEKVGGVSGKELIAAVATGAELISRIGLAVIEEQDLHNEAHPQPTQMPGYFSAAVSAGRVLRLNAQQMQSTLGLAYMQAAGGRQLVLEGRPAKAIYAGFSNQGGAISALLSLDGLEADGAIFEGKAGFFNTYYGGRYDRQALVEGLGQHYSLLSAQFKPWPTTAVAHPFIEGAISLAREHDLKPDQILSADIYGGPELRAFCEPPETRRKPQTAVEAEDSVLFAVAKALTNREVTLDDLQHAGLGQPEALLLSDRVRYHIEAEPARRGVLNVATTSGQTHSIQISRPLGHPSNPMSFSALAEKFRNCASYSANPIGPQGLADVIDLVAHLEDVPDVAAIPALLSPR